MKPKVFEKKPKELIPAKNHMAYCYAVIDSGTQEQRPYLGTPKPPAPEIMLSFEFPKELRVFTEEKGEQPMVKSVTYRNFWTDKASLYKLIKGWIGAADDFDFEMIVGKPCQVTISHDVSESNSKTYDNLGNVTAPIEEMLPVWPKMISTPVLFSIEEDGFDSQKFKDLPKWVQEKLQKSEEYAAFVAQGGGSVIDEEDIPFK